MASSPQLPGSHAWRDASGQPLPVEFFKFFRSLLTFIAETEGSTIDLAALTARVDALEAEGGSVGQLLGPNSVQVIGDLNTGDVIVKLQNDSGSPGNSYYYGTNAAGVKGWHLLSLATLADVDQTTPFAAGDAPVFDGTLFQPTAVLANPMTTEGDIIVADVGGVPDRLPIGAVGEVLTVLPGPVLGYAAGGGASGNGAIGATFDGGGSVLTPGVFTDIFVPFNCTIVGATLLADISGNLVVSVLADPYASFPPTTDLAPTTPPTITAATKSQDTTLSGWSTSIAAGTVVRLGIVSCSSITRATLSLEVTKP